MNSVVGNRVTRSLRLAFSGWLAAILLAGAFAATPLRAGDEEGEIPTRTFKMTVENFKWVPDQLRVPKGTRVVLQVRSYDATHRFDLKKPYNMKVLLPQGQTTEFEFVAKYVGTFKWRCGRPCGDGCPKMTGTLTVYDPAEAAGGEGD